MEAMNRREFLAGAAAALALPGFRRPDGARWETSFIAMDTWFWQEKDLDIPAQVELLRKLGYAGMALSWGQRHAERLKALRDRTLEMPGIYVTADIDADPPGPLAAVVDFLGGTQGRLWLALHSKKHRKSDPAGDEAAAGWISALADRCRKASLPGIALYPHVGTWMEKVGDTVRLAERLKRPDVGVMFNQYHWMATEPGQDPKKAIEAAAPWLSGVTINGSGKSASILPLGEGDYDVAPLLRALISVKYQGLISHQGYGIRGRLAERLESALRSWEGLKKKAREAAPVEIVRAHVHISGIVQGVSYRASTQAEAQKRGLVGWVKNLPDGRVEALVQGPKDKVDELLRWCKRGPSAAKVDAVDVAWEAVTEAIATFEVRY
jgi:acylphosphatase